MRCETQQAKLNHHSDALPIATFCSSRLLALLSILPVPIWTSYETSSLLLGCSSNQDGHLVQFFILIQYRVQEKTVKGLSDLERRKCHPNSHWFTSRTPQGSVAILFRDDSTRGCRDMTGKLWAGHLEEKVGSIFGNLVHHLYSCFGISKSTHSFRIT